MQVEQLLETYFMNLDNTWNRLQTLAEYVDDTEDYIKFDVRFLWAWLRQHVHAHCVRQCSKTDKHRDTEPCIIDTMCHQCRSTPRGTSSSRCGPAPGWL